MAIIGDDNGYTGAASVTYSGLASVPWLASNGSVNVTVDRIPDQYPLSAPQVVENQNVSVSSGSITVPLTFQAAHDAFAIYLTPATSSGGGFPSGYHRLVIGNDSLCLDVYGNTTAAGAAIDQWTCNGQSNQQFQFVAGSGGYGELQAQNSGDDVTVTGSATAAGTPGHRPAAGQRRRRAASGCRCSSPTGRGSSRTPPAACAWTCPAPAATSASNSTSGPARTPPAPTRTSPAQLRHEEDTSMRWRAIFRKPLTAGATLLLAASGAVAVATATATPRPRRAPALPSTARRAAGRSTGSGRSAAGAATPGC